MCNPTNLEYNSEIAESQVFKREGLEHRRRRSPLAGNGAKAEVRKARPEQGEGHALNLPPNPFQILLYLFFKLVALCEHSAKFSGQAVHLISKRFVILLFFFYANVSDGGENVILVGDLFCGGNGAEAFYIFEGAILEGGEGVGKAGDVFFGKVAVLAVYHVAHVAGIYEEGFACLLFATGDEPDGYRNCYAVEKLG